MKKRYLPLDKQVQMMGQVVQRPGIAGEFTGLAANAFLFLAIWGVLALWAWSLVRVAK